MSSSNDVADSERAREKQPELLQTPAQNTENPSSPPPENSGNGSDTAGSTGTVLAGATGFPIPSKAKFVAWQYIVPKPQSRPGEECELRQWEYPEQKAGKVIKRDGQLLPHWEPLETGFIFCLNFNSFLAGKGVPASMPEIDSVEHFVVPLSDFIDVMTGDDYEDLEPLDAAQRLFGHFIRRARSSYTFSLHIHPHDFPEEIWTIQNWEFVHLDEGIKLKREIEEWKGIVNEKIAKLLQKLDELKSRDQSYAMYEIPEVHYVTWTD